MKQLVLSVILVVSLIAAPQAVMAENVAGESAKIGNLTEDIDSNLLIAKKKMVIQKMLASYNSPLSESVDSFVATCTDHEIDCYLLPSIAGLESTFGKFVLPSSHNPFGWGGGYIMFPNWDSAIAEVGKSLKKNYIAKGADTIDKIAPIYAESKTWAKRVKYFMKKFKEEEQKLNTILSHNEVKLTYITH